MSGAASVGIVMIAHTALDRAAQVARHWAVHGCPVVIHLDKKIGDVAYQEFVEGLSDLPNLHFSSRCRCEWGTWSLVHASQTASTLMLKTYPDIRHVYLASGACLPLRPVRELIDYLAQHPDTDFIESATAGDVAWAAGGLDSERFTLRFPFSWKRHRRLFDGYVRLQRTLHFSRKIPQGLVPHLGSQWWCLTRRTLSAILDNPQRKEYDRYFKRVWIPDESYYQTLARLVSTKIESRSLTLSKFDYQGKPHAFYNDHLQLLRQSDCFVARKIWPNADQLYQAFLKNEQETVNHAEPNPGKIDRIFAKAVERRTRGRAGLYMQSRFPTEGRENGATAFPYSMFQGFSYLFEDFDSWLAKYVGVTVHGHLFASEQAEFKGGQSIYCGGISNSAMLRNSNPKAFLTNLIWNTKGKRQCFQFGPDDLQELNWFIAKDPNAHISAITGAWIVPLFHSNLTFAEIRKISARLQKIENAHMRILRSPYAKARVQVMTMAEFIENPMEPLQNIFDVIDPRNSKRLSEMPKLVDLTGFGKFLQSLKNQGMHPHLMGDFPTLDQIPLTPQRIRKPYLVRK